MLMKSDKKVRISFIPKSQKYATPLGMIQFSMSDFIFRWHDMNHIPLFEFCMLSLYLRNLKISQIRKRLWVLIEDWFHPLCLLSELSKVLPHQLLTQDGIHNDRICFSPCLWRYFQEFLALCPKKSDTRTKLAQSKHLQFVLASQSHPVHHTYLSVRPISLQFWKVGHYLMPEKLLTAKQNVCSYQNKFGRSVYTCMANAICEKTKYHMQNFKVGTRNKISVLR